MSAFIDSRQHCFLTIDGQRVDPREVRIALGQRLNQTSIFELCLGKVLLCHELQQAGVALDPSSLLSFVEEDLIKHASTAAEAYLHIVQTIVSPPPKKQLFGLVRKQTPDPKWEIIRIDRVTYGEHEQVIKITGVVRRC